MFICDNLIYLQLQKTACTHIAYLLSECIGGTQFLKHNSLKENITDKVIVGSIRNPWDWYVSLWAFSSKGDSSIYKTLIRRNFKHALKIFSGCEDTENFKSWLSDKVAKRSLLTALNAPRGLWVESQKPIKLWRESYQHLNPQNFRQWLKLICDSSKAYSFDIGYAQNNIRNFAGYMTYRYFKIFSIDFSKQAKNHGLNSINKLTDFDKKFNVLEETIMCENLEYDLLNVFQKAGYHLNSEQTNLILQSCKTNISKHFDSCYYYDQEAIELVAEKEKFIIEKYSYKPPKR